MTAVSSAAKMVAGQLKRWLTGDDEATAEGHSLTENVSADRSGGTCTLQYRGRSYSDCAAASCRSRQNAATRERSCSVNSRCLTSQGSKRPGSRACPTGRHRGGGVREVLDERSELCRCWSGSEEPVCCCERCFLYTDQPPPLLLTPPSYSELMLLERYADLAKRLTSIEPSVTIVSTADVTEHVMTATATDFISSSAETGQTNVKVSLIRLMSFKPTFFGELHCFCYTV